MGGDVGGEHEPRTKIEELRIFSENPELFSVQLQPQI